MTGSERTPAAPGERLAKTIARAGYCSRRDAERLIAEGQVKVNGKTVRTPAFNVMGDEKITIEGQLLEGRRKTRLWLYHKPVGLVVTEKDPEGRPTVFQVLAEQGLPRVLSVGRLDINTEGLLLLTNDGGLKRVLELPETGWLRKYRVRAHGSVTQEALDKLKDGITVDGVTYGAIEATLEREQGANVWLQMALREGKNREIKIVLGALGLQVTRLIRISYGPFQLGDLPLGSVSLVRARVLRDQLGERLAEKAGVDFGEDLPDVEGVQLSPRVDPNKRIGRKPAKGRGRSFRAGGAKDEAEDKRPKFDRQGRPERPSRPEKPKPEARTGRVHFDDGRPSEDMVLKAKRAPRKGAEDEPRFGAGKKTGGPRKPGPGKPSFGDKKGPARDAEAKRGGRGEGRGPQKPNRFGAGSKPGAGGGQRNAGERPQGPRRGPGRGR